MAEMTIQRMACARVPTDEGEFKLCLYRNERDGLDHLALVMGEVAGGERVLVRVHSGVSPGMCSARGAVIAASSCIARCAPSRPPGAA
jgi:hypothetical protein